MVTLCFSKIGAQIDNHSQSSRMSRGRKAVCPKGKRQKRKKMTTPSPADMEESAEEVTRPLSPDPSEGSNTTIQETQGTEGPSQPHNLQRKPFSVSNVSPSVF